MADGRAHSGPSHGNDGEAQRRGAAAGWGCLLGALLLALLLPAAPGFARDAPFARGSWEFGTRVSPSGLPAPTLGYFLGNRVELVAHFADSVLTALDTEIPDNARPHRREVQLDAAVNVPGRAPLAPYLGLGARHFTAPGAAEGTDLHALAGVRFLVGRFASLNVFLRTGTRRLDGPPGGAPREAAFTDLAVSLSRFF